MEVEEHRSSRRKFLRGVGLTLAAAVGAAAFPAAARASVNCCPTSGCTSLNCQGNDRRFFCDCAPGLEFPRFRGQVLIRRLALVR